jgi:hypothetical protein
MLWIGGVVLFLALLAVVYCHTCIGLDVIRHDGLFELIISLWTADIIYV